MRTIIAGSRDLFDLSLVENATKDSGFTITEVVCGCAQGVDTMGNKWADAHGIPVRHFPADWQKFGNRAGPIRNAKMADYADALICIHHNSPGSLNMLMQAQARDLKIFEVEIQKPIDTKSIIAYNNTRADDRKTAE